MSTQEITYTPILPEKALQKYGEAVHCHILVNLPNGKHGLLLGWCKRYDTAFNFGGMAEGQKNEDALKREIYEETHGFLLDWDTHFDLIKKGVCVTRTRDNKDYYTHLCYYNGEIDLKKANEKLTKFLEENPDLPKCEKEVERFICVPLSQIKLYVQNKNTVTCCEGNEYKPRPINWAFYEHAFEHNLFETLVPNFQRNFEEVENSSK